MAQKIVRITLLALLLPWLAQAQQVASLPSFQQTDLAAEFPEYKESGSNEERGLRRYRSQLEYFREEALEGYNKDIIAFRKQLVETDRQLELDRKKGRVSEEEYKEQHKAIAQELGNSNGSGQYMRAYYTFMKKYKSESRWVIDELSRLEKRKFRF